MDLNEKLAARRRDLGIEADRVNSSATSVPRADNPVIKDHPATENSTKSTSLTGGRSELNRTLTERFTSGLSEPELRNRIGQIFKKLEPEFDPENMIHNIGGMLFLAVTLKRVADREWIVTAEFHEDDKKNKKIWYFVSGAFLLYALLSGKMGMAFIFILALGVVAFLNTKFSDRVTSQTVKACLRNIKNELDTNPLPPQSFPGKRDTPDEIASLSVSPNDPTELTKISKVQMQDQTSPSQVNTTPPPKAPSLKNTTQNSFLFVGITVITLFYLAIMATAFYYLSSKQSCQLNEKIINELISEVTPIVNVLALQFPGEENKHNIDGSKQHLESDSANYKIDSIVGNYVCGLKYNHGRLMQKEDGHLYKDEIHSPKEKLAILEEYRLNSSLISHYNLRTRLRLLGTIVGLLLGGYFFHRLVRHKRFSTKSNLYFLLLSAPLFLTSTSLMMLNPTLTSTANEQEAITSFFISIAWICVAYPLIYINAKKQGGLKAIVFPRGQQGTPTVS